MIVPIDQLPENHRRDLIRTEPKPGSLTTLLVFHQNGRSMGEFYHEVDGFYVWDPGWRCVRHGGGFISQEILLTLGEKLRELNAPWERDIAEYFASQEECTYPGEGDTIPLFDGEPN